MAIKLAPSNNPAKESKQFSAIALVCGILSLFVWYVGIGGLAFGARGVILSKRAGDRRYLILAILGIILSLASLGYHYVTV
jgi:hypothetical protein